MVAAGGGGGGPSEAKYKALNNLKVMIKNTQKGQHPTAQMIDIEKTYDESFESTRDPVQAAKAAAERKKAFEFAARFGIVDEELKGKLPEIGTPGRFVIDTFYNNGEVEAEKLRKLLIDRNMLTKEGKPNPGLIAAVTDFKEELYKTPRFSILIQNRGQKPDQIQSRRKLDKQTSEDRQLKHETREVFDKAVEEFGLDLLQQAVSQSGAKKGAGGQKGAGGGGGNKKTRR
jgi:hypothetical protein